MRLEVIALMSHLLVTLGILALYGFTLYNGHPDTTLQNVLLVISGYWFSVLGTAMKPKEPPKDGGSK